MSPIPALAAMVSGIGLFFVGVHGLSANLVPLAGRKTRAAFARAVNGKISGAASGVLAGIATQSSSAVSWVVLGFERAGVVGEGPALAAPMWSNVGTALLPLLVAIDTLTFSSMIIGLVGFAIYFRLVRSDRMRNALEAALGAALVLFGLHAVDRAVEPLREALMGGGALPGGAGAAWIPVAIGLAFSMASQSSSVAAAIGVAGLGAHLLTMPAGLALIAGANAGAVVNNILGMRGENLAGRVVFALQALQKTFGSLLLAALAIAAYAAPDVMLPRFDAVVHSPSGQIAIAFFAAQVLGGFITSLGADHVADFIRRRTPPHPIEALGRPAFLLPAARSDTPVALDLSLREVARLAVRLPLFLDQIRAEPEPGTPATAVLRTAGGVLAGTIKTYLTDVLDHQPGRDEVAAALLLKEAVDSTADLQEALAELAAAAAPARELRVAQNLIEALHTLMTVVADHAESLGADESDFVLELFGDRDALMEDLRQRLLAGADIGPAARDALFRMTGLFERSVWLARRLVITFSRAYRALNGA